MNGNRLLVSCIGIAGCWVMCASAFAQSGQSFRLLCQSVGSSTPEPLGDRDGHSISVAEVSCRVEGGLMDGGILTGTGITEWDKTNGVLLAGSGVTRKPGATTAYRNTEAKIALTLLTARLSVPPDRGGASSPWRPGPPLPWAPRPIAIRSRAWARARRSLTSRSTSAAVAIIRSRSHSAPDAHGSSAGRGASSCTMAGLRQP